MVPGVKLSKSILFLSTTVLVCTQTLQPRVHTRSNVIAIVYVQPPQCWEGRPSYHRLHNEVGCTQKVYLSTLIYKKFTGGVADMCKSERWLLHRVTGVSHQFRDLTQRKHPEGEDLIWISFNFPKTFSTCSRNPKAGYRHKDGMWCHAQDGERTNLYGMSFAGVFALFVVMGVAGIFIHCLSIGSHGRCADGCGGSFPCYGLDCFPASMEAFGVFLIMFVIIFAILGFFYCLLAATMAIQRIWQNHYHILTKHVLTKVCIRNTWIW